MLVYQNIPYYYIKSQTLDEAEEAPPSGTLQFSYHELHWNSLRLPSDGVHSIQVFPPLISLSNGSALSTPIQERPPRVQVKTEELLWSSDLALFLADRQHHRHSLGLWV